MHCKCGLEKRVKSWGSEDRGRRLLSARENLYVEVKPAGLVSITHFQDSDM